MRSSAGTRCARADTAAQSRAQSAGGGRIRQRGHVTAGMFRFLIGPCRSCDAPVSAFALSCPSCGATNQPNPVATVAAFSALIVLTGVIALGVYAWRGKATSATGAPPPAATDKAAEYDWIVQAMADCEAEA